MKLSTDFKVRLIYCRNCIRATDLHSDLLRQVGELLSKLVKKHGANEFKEYEPLTTQVLSQQNPDSRTGRLNSEV